MAKVTFYYEDGGTQVKEIAANSYRCFGIKLNGTRPIKAIIEGEVSDEFIKSLYYVLHPSGYTIIRNGVTVADIKEY